MIVATITDGSGSLTFPALEVPVTVETLEGSNDVVTLDNNVRTDFTNPKRLVSFPYESLTETEFNNIKAFYDRQFTLFAYPLITIEELGIEDMPARMMLSPRNVYNNCGDVQDVKVSFRESVQLPVIGSS